MSEGQERRDGQVGRTGLAGRVSPLGRPGQMRRAGQLRRPGRLAALFALVLVSTNLRAADNARQIVDEAQKRTDARSQRYEGLLQVFDAKGKISDKRWTMERLGAHGQSKAVLRFTVPAEVKV